VTTRQASDVEPIEVPADLTVAPAPGAGLEDHGVLIKDIMGSNFLAHWINSPKLLNVQNRVYFTPFGSIKH
jgi:hypothetical protein